VDRVVDGSVGIDTLASMLYGCVCIDAHRYALMLNGENKKARIPAYLVCSTKIKKQRL
jgi:hypothetical protein